MCNTSTFELQILPLLIKQNYWRNVHSLWRVWWTDWIQFNNLSLCFTNRTYKPSSVGPSVGVPAQPSMNTDWPSKASQVWTSRSWNVFPHVFPYCSLPSDKSTKNVFWSPQKQSVINTHTQTRHSSQSYMNMTNLAPLTWPPSSFLVWCIERELDCSSAECATVAHCLTQA